MNKPFNLEKALAGEPVVTRDGREVKQITKFKCTESCPIIGVIDGSIRSFTFDGEYFDAGGESENDLFMKSVKRKYWIITYINHSNSRAHRMTTSLLENKENALSCLDQFNKVENYANCQLHEIEVEE